MKDIFAIFISMGASALPPALAFAIYQSITHSFDYFPSTFLLAAIYASAHALIFGVPVALILMRMRLFRPIPMFLAGAIVGILPAGIFTFLSSPNYWQNPLFLFASFSLLGAAGGLTFYFVYQGLSPNNSFKPTPLRGAA